MVEKKGFNNSESLKNNKKLRVFLLFLLLSILFWSLIKLQKEYITDIEFELVYSDVPKNKLIQNQPDTRVKLTLKTTGFKLLNYGFKEKTLDYSLTEVERKEGTFFFSETRSSLNYLQAQLSAETLVLNIEPDTLFFDLGVKKSKKVAVESQVKFQFKTGYNFVKPYDLGPGEISISGPAKVIDTIDEIFTEDLELRNISDSFEKKVKLLSPNEVVVLSEEEVVIKGEVDKITDGSYNLSFDVINLPRGVIISTYPKEVKVVYQVALKDYNKIPENAFRVHCDYKQTEDNNLDYLIPKLVDKPEIIHDVKIVPNKIEFLIKK